MKIWLKQLLCHHLWDKRCHWYRGDLPFIKSVDSVERLRNDRKMGLM